LKNINQSKQKDLTMFDRFGDNCQYKTIKQYGMNNTVANGGIRRPGAYGLA